MNPLFQMKTDFSQHKVDVSKNNFWKRKIAKIIEKSIKDNKFKQYS